MNNASRWIACAAVIPFLFVATGCGDESFDPADLQKEVAKTLKPTAGDVKVKCPDDISTKVGTKVTCTVTAANGNKADFVITIADKDGNFTIAPAK
jgi:Domain of unknown function (DUF4333)